VRSGYVLRSRFRTIVLGASGSDNEQPCCGPGEEVRLGHSKIVTTAKKFISPSTVMAANTMFSPTVPLL
jgi:hypothetical protein